MTRNLIKLIADEKIFPIIRSSDSSKVVDIAKALVDGGINIVEINIENVGIYKAIEKVSEFTNVCAGGIITSLQADAAIKSGAKLLSSPIYSINLIKLSKDKKIPFIAGASTANEAYSAWKARIPLIKIYPITAMGGVSYIENILRPMPFLNFLPSGNIKLDQVKEYLKAGAKAVGIGRDLYADYSFNEITTRIAKTLKEV